MPFALRISFLHEGAANPPATRVIDGLLALDPGASISAAESGRLAIADVPEIRRDLDLLRSVHITLAIAHESCAAELELLPQVTLTIGRLPAAMSLDACTALLDAACRWTAADFGSVQELEETIGAAGSLDYLRRAAINIADARYETLGPVAPGAATRTSGRVSALCSTPWVASDGPGRPTQADYRAFCDCGLGAPCSIVDGPVVFGPPAAWRPLAAVRTKPRAASDAAVLSTLADTVDSPDPVDLADLDVAAGTSLVAADLSNARLWFLGVADIVLRWVVLEDALLLECGFEHCDLRGVSVANAVVDQTLFTDCRLDGMDAEGSTFSECRLVGCKLVGASLSGAKVDRTRFEHCDLRNVDFADSTHPGSEYVACSLDPAARAHIVATGGAVFDPP